MSAINEKHLEFIQGVINRHNSNSFKIKGWAITITSAIFALTGTIKEPYLCFIAIGPIMMFWILDSMFLANERCFVSLYSCVAKGNKIKIPKEQLKKKIRKVLDNDPTIISKEYSVTDYSMNFVQFKELKRNNWVSVIGSYTIRWFYLVLILLTLITFYGLKTLNKAEEVKPLNINATITNSNNLNINPIDVNARIISSDTLKIKEISKPIKIIKTKKK
ncbi:hypothetical protein F7642_12680 [Tenacibaculum finnmarkense genomovar ulcerans]|uniref:hypothetical protein n=1 Tax=Tenacibaculum finnmarkense TaxID=2781243 RepID=UPI00187B7FDE|nr:hypothetical protein [Tenacibaculum finnmarkense]MBE7635178.1 hypothetical protein [Tenacibaculum finnmarkense genomovar ulcerans]MCD8431130.1 hypothetical protein [Tenacibaculum finnmarkense genomovar ulcerans]